MRAVVRGVAQSGSASVLGTEGRRFESYRPDQSLKFRSVEIWAVAAQAQAGFGRSTDAAVQRDSGQVHPDSQGRLLSLPNIMPFTILTRDPQH
jgi:hypothetical protein